MFGVVPKAIWSRLTTPDDENRIPLQTNCLLLEDGTNRVLIECGYGEKWEEKERRIFALESRTVIDALAEISIDPADLTHIILTHLHFDHAGALTRWNAARDAVPTFPNATIFVQRTEWNDALANRSTMTRTYLRSHLDPIEDRVELVDREADVLPGIRVMPMPGHTWGQQAVFFNDEAGIVCFPGDVMPTVNHAGLAFSMGYDMEPYTNMHSKQRLLDRALLEGWRVVLDHEPGHAVVSVAREGERCVLKPAAMPAGPR